MHLTFRRTMSGLLCDNLPFEAATKATTKLPEQAFTFTKERTWKTCQDILSKTSLNLVDIAKEIVVKSEEEEGSGSDEWYNSYESGDGSNIIDVVVGTGNETGSGEEDGPDAAAAASVVVPVNKH